MFVDIVGFYLAAERQTPAQVFVSLEKLMATLREYPLPSRKRFTLEYVLLKDINHSKEDALRLAKLTEGLRIKVNLIPYNTFPGTCYASPSERDILTFQAMLRQKGISTFIRRSRGQEISAACGMLRWREAE
jgi:23S rRNA (adenine2503-C2)-methyltransferase